MKKEEFLHRAEEIWHGAYTYPNLPDVLSSKKPLVCYCPKHDYTFTVPMMQNHISKSVPKPTGCPYCEGSRRRITMEEREAELKVKAERKAERERKRKQAERERKAHKIEKQMYVEAHGYDVAHMTEKQISQHYASIKGKESPYQQAVSKRKQERIAKHKQERKEQIEQQRNNQLAKYINQAKQVHGDKYDYSHTDYVKKEYRGTMRWVLENILCPEHGYFDARPEVHILQGCECPQCAGFYNHGTPEQRKEYLINKAKSRFGDRFDYSEVVYTNKHDLVWITCREHHYRFKTNLSEHCRGAGCCPFCSNSSGEVDVRKWLEDHHVDFTPQYQIPNDNPDCIRQYFVIDFYLPKHNCFIEFNGGQHYMDIPYFRQGGWNLEQQQLRDRLVRKYADEHGIKLIEIPYTEQDKIPEILSKELNI